MFAFCFDCIYLGEERGTLEQVRREVFHRQASCLLHQVLVSYELGHKADAQARLFTAAPPLLWSDLEPLERVYPRPQVDYQCLVLFIHLPDSSFQESSRCRRVSSRVDLESILERCDVEEFIVPVLSKDLIIELSE